MAYSVYQWHQRFEEQSKWTAPLREFLFSQAEIQNARCILEVGCGTGAILNDVEKKHELTAFGIDLLQDRCIFAQHSTNIPNITQADAISLPFKSKSFDIVYCHYFFLWLNDRTDQAIEEMARVTKKGGKILALAEPDHSARIDYPIEFEALGKAQTQALTFQGVDTMMGRKLPQLFSRAGLEDIRFGLSGFQSNIGVLPDSFESEWSVIETDLHNEISLNELQEMQTRDEAAWSKGERVLYVPTFYAIGTVV